MSIKKLAYLKVKIKSCNDDFCEIYTFLKPTVLYLPNHLILTIEDIDKNKICLTVTSSCNNHLCKKVVLSLCDPKVKIETTCCCNDITLCLELCQIKFLCPCHRCDDCL